MEVIGEIIITNNLEDEVSYLREQYPNVRVFPINEDEFKKGSFQIKHAREAIDESYISSNDLKVIILAADSFNVESQNALLKSLEEPPNNIKFILVTRHKSSILPTILSRMLIINKKIKTPIKELDLDLKRLNLSHISAFLNSLSFGISKEELREKVASLLFGIKKAKIRLNRNELDYFSKAIVEINAGEQARYVFLKLLLMILEHNKRNPV